MSDTAPLDRNPPPRAVPDTPKSRRTRARILNVAMSMIAEIGYAGAANPKIAEAAGLTRGAMLYHFPDRESLVEAVVEHIQRARQGLLQEAVNSAPHGADRTDHAIDAYWRVLNEPAFIAFTELERAARTDPMVQTQVAEAQAAFDRAEGDRLFDLVQGGSGPRLQAGRDLARFHAGRPRPGQTGLRCGDAARQPPRRGQARRADAEPQGLGAGPLAGRLTPV